MTSFFVNHHKLPFERDLALRLNKHEPSLNKLLKLSVSREDNKHFLMSVATTLMRGNRYI